MFLRSTFQRFFFTLTALVVLAAAVTVPPADAAVNFAGKRVTFIVPLAVGGGTDAMVRFLAPFFHRHLPGNPTIIVRNVPGAGSIRGTNLFEDARPDGLSVLWPSFTTINNYNLQDKRVRFHPEKWIPVFNAPSGSAVYARTDLGLTGNPVEDIKILQKKQLVMGANSPTSGELPRLLTMYLLGLNIRPVFGLNRGEVRLPFERGEFNINYDTMAAYLQNALPLVKSGVATPLYSFGVWDARKKQLVRDPSVPDMPHFGEVYEGVYGKKPSGPEWRLTQVMMNAATMVSKQAVLPGGTPKDIVETWNRASEKVSKDEQFLNQKELQIGAYDILLREEAKENLMGGIALDDESRAWLRNFLFEQYGVKLD